MRGKLFWLISFGGLPRITPAHAGKTSFAPLNNRTIEDHPRACGENQLRFYRHHRKRGSPPRMRGKRFFLGFPLPKTRITPEHAGKTTLLQSQSTGLKDHPRACGENARLQQKMPLLNRSPPRMRGKLPSIICGSASTRITPAHAGKTHTLIDCRVRRGGSPPRMRGKLKPDFGRDGRSRITPAHAGKTNGLT